jgi:hypothetical protein
MERRVPFQVMLDPEQHRQLRGAAQRGGQSIGSLVRESVARYLAAIAVDDDPLMGLIGLGEDAGPRPHGDVATQHDAYMANASAGEPSAKAARAARASSTRRPKRAIRAG